MFSANKSFRNIKIRKSGFKAGIIFFTAIF